MRIIKKIEPKHCCETCQHATYDGSFSCALDPDNQETSWDSGDIAMGYTVTCNKWRTNKPAMFNCMSCGLKRPLSTRTARGCCRVCAGMGK